MEQLRVLVHQSAPFPSLSISLDTRPCLMHRRNGLISVKLFPQQSVNSLVYSVCQQRTDSSNRPWLCGQAGPVSSGV